MSWIAKRILALSTMTFSLDLPSIYARRQVGGGADDQGGQHSPQFVRWEPHRSRASKCDRMSNNKTHSLSVGPALRSSSSPSTAVFMLRALLDNVTTVLLIVPVTLAIVRALEVPAYPYLFAEIFASNIGGTATLIGDPPNILIGSQVGLTFNDFVYHLAPIVLVVLTAQMAMVHFVWGKELRARPEDRARVMSMQPNAEIRDPLLLKQSLAVLFAVVVAFVLARQLHVEPATIAMSGAAALMLLDNWAHHRERASHNIHQTFGDVEWITIFFFIGLFIIVHGVEVAGLLKLVGTALVLVSGNDLATAGYTILWSSAFLSAIIDNIPFVATMIPLIKSTAAAYGGAENIEPLWWCLSLGACLGGNGTLIGASANLTVAGISERNGVPFRFGTYLLFGLPMMVVSIMICRIYVWWRYF